MAPPSATDPMPPTPRRARRATARTVLVADAVAAVVVRVGGLLTIVAVVGILVFLVATVLPLLDTARLVPAPVVGRLPVEGAPRAVVVDEYRLVAWAVGDAPEVVHFRADTGEVLARLPIPGLEGGRVVAAARSPRGTGVVAATADGRLGFAAAGFASDFVLGPEAAALRKAAPAEGDTLVVEGAVVRRRSGGNLLRVRPVAQPVGSARLPEGAAAPAALAYATHDGDGVVAAVDAAGALHLLREAREEVDGAPRAVFRPLPAADGGPRVPEGAAWVVVDDDRQTVWAAAPSGALLRVDVRRDPAVRREARQTVDAGGARLTCLGALIGGRSVVVGDDAGDVSVWSPSPLPPERVGKDGDPGDGRVIVGLRAFPRLPAPVRTIQPAEASRVLYLGHEDGSVTLAYGTNGRVLGRVDAFRAPVVAIAASKSGDGIVVAGADGAWREFLVDCPHPEASLQSLFLPVHYEGYAEPELRWESTSASDESEKKFSLTPLLFGTIKATFYAMVFALPLALLGALYTSQFMHRRLRGVVKPAVEVMASLPSVVLGFLAALVLAPAVEQVVPGVFAAVASLVLVGVLAGCVWYLVPTHRRDAVTPLGRLGIALVLAAAAVVGSVAASPSIEGALFRGDFRAWLSCAPGTGDGLPLLRVGLFVLGSAVGVFVVPRWLRPAAGASRSLGRGAARAMLCAVLPGLALALLAPLAESLLFGGDFRWWLVGEDRGASPPGTVYDQRNSLVVGLAMGFAVIPLVYTIAEDALSAIPESLKSAALGCGASPWQTALRVVVPAAAPGIFSAAMIGLGRAVGETMIVLMAAGGTAIMDGSIFNGFRTLSANIATELPEAAQGDTHYRILFLAALLLFALTFVLNTVAEAVRLRFRRRFRQL